SLGDDLDLGPSAPQACGRLDELVASAFGPGPVHVVLAAARRERGAVGSWAATFRAAAGGGKCRDALPDVFSPAVGSLQPDADQANRAAGPFGAAARLGGILSLWRSRLIGRRDRRRLRRIGRGSGLPRLGHGTVVIAVDLIHAGG